MSLNIASGITTSSITGTVTFTPALPTPSASQTLVNVEFTMTGSIATAYTVTTGKTFYLFGFTCEDSTTPIMFYANDGTTRRCYYRQLATTGAVSPNMNSSIPISSWTTGQAVKINGQNTVKIQFWGVEQ